MVNLDIIRKTRKYKELTLQEMAKLSGYKSPSAYQAAESGKNRVPIDKLCKIAEALDLDVADLLICNGGDSDD